MVAVKVTDDALQVGLVPEVMAMLAEVATAAGILMVIGELVAVVGLAHVALEVSTQRITSPLTIPVPATAE
jgi:hypothetical protein